MAGGFCGERTSGFHRKGEERMKVLITGTSQGIGKAIAELFLNKGHEVIGIDRQENRIEHSAYTHS